MLSQTAGFFTTLDDALAAKAETTGKVNALNAITALCSALGRVSEPFVVPLLPNVLLSAGDKVSWRSRAVQAWQK